MRQKLLHVSADRIAESASWSAGSLDSRLKFGGEPIAAALCMSKGPDIVYILKSGRHQDRFYTGITTDVAQRLEFHNAGLSKHTATGRPWSVVATIQFADEFRAQQFEYYLKTGSGRAFAERHFR